MTSDIEGALSFIEKTTLKPMVSQRLLSEEISFYQYDHRYSAAVIAATGVAFSSNVSRQQKIDVGYCERHHMIFVRIHSLHIEMDRSSI